jgi:micrococcal nuclease
MRGTAVARVALGVGLVIALGTATGVAVVYDGDTFLTSESLPVRLLGIDAPESYQPGGDIARDILEKYLLGRTVRLAADSADKDEYGRLLRYVYVGDTLVNAELVRKGYAGYRSFQPRLRFGDSLEALQAEAARTGRGLWSFNVFEPPGIEMLRERVRAESSRTQAGLEVVSWLEAAKHVGRLVAVEGRVVTTYNSGKVCHLNFHEDYRRHFSVAIFARDSAKFPPEPEQHYLRRNVRVTGVVKSYRGAPEMIANDARQIELLLDE